MGPEYFWWGGMWIFPFIGLTVMVIVLFLIFGRGGFRPPWYFSHGHHQEGWNDSDRAMAILKERYARGEIGKEEFEQMKRDLI